MDAHSRVRYMLHKCNRARRENAASGILFYAYLSSVEFYAKHRDVVKLRSLSDKFVD